MTPADVHAEPARPFVQQSHQARLLDHQCVHRVVRHVGEGHLHAGEDPASHPLRRAGRTAEFVVQTAHIEGPNHLPDKAIGLWLGTGLGQALEHDRSDTGESELACHHKAVRPGAGNDDVDSICGHS